METKGAKKVTLVSFRSNYEKTEDSFTKHTIGDGKTTKALE